MDRIEFPSSIDNISSDDIIKSFDSVMALYNIVDRYDNIKISKSSTEIASFDLILSEDTHTVDICKSCNGVSIDLYSQRVQIQCDTVNQRTLHISFVPVG